VSILREARVLYDIGADYMLFAFGVALERAGLFDTI
jgi:hypothetical protein